MIYVLRCWLTDLFQTKGLASLEVCDALSVDALFEPKGGRQRH